MISPQRHVRICPFDRNMAIVCWSAIIIKHRMRFSVKGGTVRGVGVLSLEGFFLHCLRNIHVPGVFHCIIFVCIYYTRMPFLTYNFESSCAKMGSFK